MLIQLDIYPRDPPTIEKCISHMTIVVLMTITAGMMVDEVRSRALTIFRQRSVMTIVALPARTIGAELSHSMAGNADARDRGRLPIVRPCRIPHGTLRVAIEVVPTCTQTRLSHQRRETYGVPQPPVSHPKEVDPLAASYASYLSARQKANSATVTTPPRPGQGAFSPPSSSHSSNSDARRHKVGHAKVSSTRGVCSQDLSWLS